MARNRSSFRGIATSNLERERVDPLRSCRESRRFRGENRSALSIERSRGSTGRCVGWPISCQSNWLAGQEPGRGGGGGEPCARLALTAFHRSCMHASKRGSVHACPCNACNPFDRVRREGVDRSGKVSASATVREPVWVRERARTSVYRREADCVTERLNVGETEIASTYIRARTRTRMHGRLPWR